MIKKTLTIAAVMIMMALACRGGNDNPDDFVAKMQFASTVCNLGDISAGSGDHSVRFPFVNTGNAPLVITYLHASCSCARATYPRQPIAPGDSAGIDVVFNPKNLPEGSFKRAIVLRANTQPEKHHLNIIGNIPALPEK